MFATIALVLAPIQAPAQASVQAPVRAPVQAAPPSASAPAPAGCASPLPADRLAGRWIGTFAQVDWTVELTRDGTTWAGRYMSTKTWHPLEAVAVTGGCVRFSLKSQPKLTFVLTLAPDGDTLAGDIEIAGYVTLPFAAKRVS